MSRVFLSFKLKIDALKLKVQAGENLKLQLAKVLAGETTLETNLIIDSVGEGFNSARSLRRHTALWRERVLVHCG